MRWIILTSEKSGKLRGRTFWKLFCRERKQMACTFFLLFCAEHGHDTRGGGDYFTDTRMNTNIKYGRAETQEKSGSLRPLWSCTSGLGLLTSRLFKVRKIQPVICFLICCFLDPLFFFCRLTILSDKFTGLFEDRKRNIYVKSITQFLTYSK